MKKYYSGLLLMLCTTGMMAQQPAYRNKGLSPDARAADLLKRMTRYE